MSTMREMALEYRRAAAKLALKIQDKKDSGAGETELRPLQYALREIRETQRLLDGYYDVPRAGEISAAGWKAGRACGDD